MLIKIKGDDKMVKKKNTSDHIYDFNCMLLSALSFDENSCFMESSAEKAVSMDTLKEEYADCNDAIFDYQILLNDAILHNDTKQIASLRRSIQTIKITKRRVKERMDILKKSEKETVKS